MPEISADEFNQFVNRVLEETAIICREYFQNHGQVTTKNDNSPVTEADQKIEALIREHIEKAYPNHSIIGEEGEDKKTDSTYCWVIDPIDGTKAFIAGKPTFTTLIGLMCDGVPTYGVVDQPIIERRWSAMASYIPKSCATGSVAGEALHGLRLATTSEGYFSDNQLKGLEEMKKQGASIAHGGDAYSYMLLTEGEFDAVFDVGFKPHDIIPLLPILEQAGVWVGFFESGKISEKITSNVVVAKNQGIGHVLLSHLV